MNPNITKQVFWYRTPNGCPRIVDGVDRGAEDGRLVGKYSGQDIGGLSDDYHGVRIDNIDTFIQLEEAWWRRPPAAITKSEYLNALSELPPHDWQRKGGGESFKMVERTSGRMTRIYACMGDTYWTLLDRDDMKHTEIMGKIAAGVRGDDDAQ